MSKNTEVKTKYKGQKHGNIFGITISGTQEAEVLDEINSSLKNKSKLFITTPNPEILLEAKKNKELLKALRNSDIKICDGVGLQLALWLQGNRPERIRGRELMTKLFTVANDKKLKVYLLGSTPEVIKKIINRPALPAGRLIDEYPNIKVKGSSGPLLDKKALPINKENEKLQKQVVQEIKKFKPDILFVAFGAPKQEVWINQNKNKLPVHVFMAIGGALDVYSGIKPVPPSWLASLGLEWLWRLVHEPQRLGRIFKAVVIFPLAVLFLNKSK